MVSEVENEKLEVQLLLLTAIISYLGTLYAVFKALEGVTGTL